MTKIAAHEHEDQHEHEHSHDHHHDHDHDHSHDDHDHDHKHGSGLLFTVASALHLPGYAHQHGSLSAEESFYHNDLAIRTVKLAFLALGITTAIQIVIVLMSGSVALLGDTIHNLGDALNSIPLWIAYILAKRPPNKRYTYGYGRTEDIAGVIIIATIAFSAIYILWESVQKLFHPQPIQNLGWVAVAAVVGFIGNEAVAVMQIRVGRQIGSEAMIADGIHARTDGLTSLAVLIAVVGSWLGFYIVDAIVGIVIGIAIIFITRDAALAIWYRLMDAVDPALVEKAEQTIKAHTEIKQLHRLQLRWLGHRLYAEIVVALESTLTASEIEAVTDHLSHELFHTLPNLADATIATVPWSANGATFWQESRHHRVAMREKRETPIATG